MKHINKFFGILLSIAFFFSLSIEAEVTTIDHGNTFTISTDYGDVELFKQDPNDALLIALIKHPVIERLKGIHQYGPSHYVKQHIVYKAQIQNDYTRWEHSLGVLVLLRRYCASLTEQIAGLFHDSSHTVLSHVGCVLFKQDQNSKTAYQDDVLEEFLIKRGIAKIVGDYGINPKNILIKNVPALKKDAPELCADNLEYILKGGLLAGFLSKEDIKEILNTLKLDPKTKNWYFTNQTAATKFAVTSLKLAQTNTGSLWNAVLYKFTALAIKRALDLKILSKEDILFEKQDNDVWFILAANQDKQLAFLRECIMKHEKTYHILEFESKELDCITIDTKFRGIDPWVQTGDKDFKKLLDLNQDFCNFFKGIVFQHKGKTVKFINGYAFLASAINSLGGIKGQ